jgi:hypothetical protein
MQNEAENHRNMRMSLLAWKNEFFNPTTNLQRNDAQKSASKSHHATSDKQR